MSEQKRYTAQEIREMADKLDGENSEYAICHYDKRDGEWQPLWANPNSAVLALRQAADAEEENAQLKARLDAVVKEIEGRDWINDGDLADSILRAARGEGGAE